MSQTALVRHLNMSRRERRLWTILEKVATAICYLIAGLVISAAAVCVGVMAALFVYSNIITF